MLFHLIALTSRGHISRSRHLAVPTFVTLACHTSPTQLKSRDSVIVLRDSQDLKPGELEEQQAKFEIVFKDIEELSSQGIQILPPGDLEKLRKRYREIHSTFEQYRKPKQKGVYL